MEKKNTNAKLTISSNAVFEMYKNKVVAFNIAYGQWMRFPYECYSYLKKAVELQMNEEEFIKCFNDKEDRIYVKELIDNLTKIKVLNEEDNKKEIDNISILVTDRCNLYCKHCAANSQKLNVKCDAPTEKLLERIDKVIKCNPKSITISGGEPLVRDDFKEIISYIKSNSEVDIDLMTNATLIDEEMARFIADNVGVVDISLDGYDESSCSLIRGKNVFGKVINSIKLLKKYNMTEIALSMVDIHNSPYEQNKFKELCNEFGVTPVIRVLSASGRAMDNLEFLESETQIKDIYEKENEAVFPTKARMEEMLKACTCTAGSKCFTVQANGDIVPCDAFSCENVVIGNIDNISELSDFIMSEEYLNNIGMGTFLDYSPYGNVTCKDCQVRHFCLSCPFQVYDYIKHRGTFEQYCKARKAYFFEMIWEEEIE